MTTIALFHSVLGVRLAIDHARRAAPYGHDVHVVDPYGGRFATIDEQANSYVERRA
jgi:hypothetical protein